ncbi:hypothetical protein HFO56_33925 [Rhizobium laguerreae]|uniref:hypothetical protein n=1 Tax=Rhizobium laguerreae TaxID=1076926 RepID=UPI001C8FCC09|nr:hypothetical protein [Rhizobium laguerreae]MBY3157327.1 hypothetical protein [Rhizobium laguerreae]
MEITTGELEHLVNVAKAYGVRTDARTRSKDAKVAVEEAEVQVRHFGRFADCGDGYRSQLDEAKGVFSAALASEIASEKAFKRSRLTAIEQHPGLQQLIEEVVYDKPKPILTAA